MVYTHLSSLCNRVPEQRSICSGHSQGHSHSVCSMRWQFRQSLSTVLHGQKARTWSHVLLTTPKKVLVPGIWDTWKTKYIAIIKYTETIMHREKIFWFIKSDDKYFSCYACVYTILNRFYTKLYVTEMDNIVCVRCWVSQIIQFKHVYFQKNRKNFHRFTKNSLEIILQDNGWVCSKAHVTFTCHDLILVTWICRSQERDTILSD